MNGGRSAEVTPTKKASCTYVYPLELVTVVLNNRDDTSMWPCADDIDAVVTITLGRAPVPGAPDVLTCEALEVKFHIGHAALQLDNLFGGDGELGNPIILSYLLLI